MLVQAGAAGDAESAGRLLDRVLDAIAKITDNDRLEALAEAATALVQAGAAGVAKSTGSPLDRVLDAIAQTINR